MAPLADTDVVIVEAVRSPLGRRNGGLSTVHPADLLGGVQVGAIERSGIDPTEVGQLVGGCVSQVGEQTFNIARTAWLAAGMPLEVAATTVDAQCGSSQQATNLAATLVKAGAVEVALSCGVESMSRVPLGAAVRGDFGRPTPKSYFARYEVTSQFEGAERIAEKWGITREDCDRFGLESQTRAQRAWAEGRFEREVLPGRRAGRRRGRQAHRFHPRSHPRRRPARDVARSVGQAQAGRARERRAHRRVVVPDHRRRRGSAADDGSQGEGPRAAPAGPDRRPVPRRGGPGADADRSDRRDPPAARAHRLGMADIDTVEINEAFASVVLAWERELKPDMEKVNPNGGAIAIGHPVGATGARLVTTALHELERTDGTLGLITMCCGGGLGTGTIIERL